MDLPTAALPLLHRQRGLARRRDLLACGMTRWQVDRLVGVGVLRPVHGDVLSTSERAAADPVRAAAVALGAVASHTSAARVWGIELLDVPGCEVTVGRDRSRAAWPGARVHRCGLAPDEVRVVEGLRVTSPVRTVLDLALTLTLPAAVASADAAVRSELVGLADLRRACAALPSGQQRSRVARVLRLVDPRSGSVLESVCRVLFAEAGLPAPLTQFEVRRFDGRLLGRVDFAWLAQRLVVETDGFAFHADRASYRSDRRRTNVLVLDGWRVLRFSWEDVVHRPDDVVDAVRLALQHTR